MADVNTIRSTNNAIFDDIFWVHLAYGTADDPLGRVQALLRDEPSYARILAGFETIDVGRRALEEPGAAPAARRAAENAIWEGNVELLRHEQQALVQPNFDRLSCSFARLISLGAATSFEVRGVRHEIAYFTSFFGYSLTRGAASALRDRSWPRITRYEDRWNWLVMSVVPRFRRFDAMAGLMQTSLRRIGDEASAYAALPCVPPLTPARMG
jgi:hypothetical protein